MLGEPYSELEEEMRLDRNMCGGVLAVVVLLLASCTAGDVTESTTDETAPPVVAEVAFDHAALMGNFAREFNADNSEALANLFTDDGCRMPPSQPIVEGRAMLLAQLEAATSMTTGELKLTLTSSESSGELAHGTGTFERLAADGSTMEFGKWMGTYKLVDGVWKMHCDIWNANPPRSDDSQ